IMIESHQGQSLDANELMVALDTHIAWSDKPVRFKGAFGVVEAAGMRLFNGGKFVQFTGPARAIIHPKENP
ncbi:MAG: hypothetical protein EBQ89_06615, partial [Alphaproteobacteria bacterium]|nr:hypothetical protein [Alphaproteobacteria bacterium]